MSNADNNSGSEGEYIRFNTESNAIDYLEKTLYFLKQTREEKGDWKWVAISLFEAMYSFAICSLKGTSSKAVTRSNDFLIKFNEAIEKCQKDKWMQHNVNSQTLTITKDEEESISILKDLLRDNFVHFTPKSWTIEISGLPKVVKDCIRVTEFLALETNNFQHHLSEEQKDRIRTLIQEIRNLAR